MLRLLVLKLVDYRARVIDRQRPLVAGGGVALV
jgi:hypothetical protein